MKTLSSFSFKKFLTTLAVGLSVCVYAQADDHGHTKDKKQSVEETQPQSFDLSELTCWDVMTLEDADRGTVLFLYYGYVSGAKGELKHDGQTIAKILSDLGNYCNENPDDKLLEVMMKG